MEIFYEWNQVRSLYRSLEQQKTIQPSMPILQNYKFQKKVNFLKTKDGLLHFQLNRDSTGVLKVHEKIESMEKLIKSHPGEFRVPFLMKVNGVSGADNILINLNESNGLNDEDQITYFKDKDGK
jgi:hypothetical protein